MTPHRTLPLILPESTKSGAIYDPCSDFVTFVLKLIEGGFMPDTLPQDYYDLYLLDFYDAQVRNGGHSQFIHNSFQNLHANLAGATRGARVLGLTQSVQLLEETTRWVEEHPKEAAAQTGFDVRADALDPLDKRLYGNEFSPEEMAEYLETQPPAFKTWWEEVSAENDSYAHSKHHVLFAAWCFAHPELKFVAGDAWKDETQALIDANPAAAHEVRTRKLEFCHRFMPDAVHLAMAGAVAQAITPPQKLEIEPSGVQHAFKNGQNVLVKLKDQEVLMKRAGSALTLHRIWTANDFGAKILLDVIRPFVSFQTWLKVSKWIKQPRPGRVVGRAEIDPALEALVENLHVPEALVLWATDPELRIFYRRGILVQADPGAQKFVWRFEHFLEMVTLEADAKGVKIQTEKTQAGEYFSQSRLAEYRAAHTRDPVPSKR